MLLTQPFPGHLPSARLLRFTAAAGFVVFLILFLFRPFNIDYPGNHFSAWHAAVYGLGTFFNTSLNGLLLPLLFPRIFREERWNVAKELLMMMWQVTSTAFVNLAITHILYGVDFTVAHLFEFLVITASIGIFPVALIILLKQQLLFKRYAAQAADMKAHLPRQEEAASSAEETLPAAHQPELILTGDNQDELLRMAPDDLLFITAADNYIRVHYLQAGKPVQKVLRSTLKKAEGALTAHPRLFRCHRAYIVNLAAVSHISGNAQGFKLHLHDADQPVPVSRNLNNELPALLERYTSSSRSSR